MMILTNRNEVRWRTQIYLFTLFLTVTVAATTKRGTCDPRGTRKAYPDGMCECYPCWHGDTCSEYASEPPKFTKEHVTASITSDHVNNGKGNGKAFFKADAVDPDADTTRALCKDMSDCPCATLKYRIINQSGETAFQIDTKTGHVSLKKDERPFQKKVDLTLGVEDASGAYDMDQMVLTVVDNVDNKFVGDMDENEGLQGYDNEPYENLVEDWESDDDDEPHIRHKRSAGLPANVTFNLQKVGTNAAATKLGQGQKVEFKLDIEFPDGETDITVEIFAPDGDNTIMTLCNVQVTVNKLTVSGTTEPVMEGSPADRAVISLDKVTTSGNSLADNTMTITYEAIMLNDAAAVADTDYWVSIGAEFNNENDLWVGQASFQADKDFDAKPGTPDVTLNGPDKIPIGGSAMYTFEMTVPYAIQDINFDVFAPINATETLALCGLQVANISKTFACSMKNQWEYVATEYANGNKEGMGRMRLELGTIVNEVWVDDQSDTSTITIQMQVRAANDETKVGEKYWVGGSAEIGADIIWAGQLEVTMEAAASGGSSVTPSFNVEFVGEDKVNQYLPVTLALNVTIPENTAAEYTLEVITDSVDEIPVIQVCSVILVSKGGNFPCLKIEGLEATYEATSNTSAHTDRAILNIGTVANAAPWAPSSGNGSENQLTFHILLKSTPQAVANTEYNVLLGMYVGKTRLVIGKTGVTVADSSFVPISNITSENSPTFAMSYADGEDKVAIGKTIKTLLEVTTSPDTIYKPFNVEFIMPNDTGESLLQICKVQLHKKGKNVPCVKDPTIEKGTELVSSFGDGITDRAVLNMISLCNSQAENDTSEDVITLSASIFVRQHDAWPSNAEKEVWVNAGVMFSEYNLWVGQIKLTVDSTMTIDAMAVEPVVHVVPNNGILNNADDTISEIPRGYPAKSLIRIKTSPNDTSEMKLKVVSVGEQVSLCGIRVVRFGDSFPCASLSTNTSGNATAEDTETGIVKEIEIDLGFLANVGTENMEDNNKFDGNTIELELSTKISIDKSVAADASTHILEYIVSYDPNLAKSVTATTTVTVGGDESTVKSFTTAKASDIGDISVYSITGQSTPETNEDLTKIVKGESKRFVVELDTALNSTVKMEVKFETEEAKREVLDILYVGVLSTGSNIQCLKAQQTKDKYAPKNADDTTNQMGQLDLSYVANSGIDTADPEANKILVECIVRLLKSDKIAKDDTFDLTATLMSHEDDIETKTKTMTVGDETTYVDLYANSNQELNGSAVRLNMSDEAITLEIGETKIISLLFQIPLYTSSRVWFDGSMEVNGSAIMTVNSVAVTKVGRNLGYDWTAYEDEFTDIKTSDQQTTQINTWEKHIGIVSNPGVTVNRGDYVVEDDVISVDYEVQMADHHMAVDGATFDASFGLHVDKYIFILDIPVTVKRTGSEKLDFNITASINDNTTTKDHIEINMELAHSTDSKREGIDTVFLMYIPKYVEFVESATNVTSPNKLLDTEINGGQIALHFGPLYFTDDIKFSITLQPKAGQKVPLGITGKDTVFTYQAVTNTTDDNDVASKMDYLNFTVTVAPSAGDQCSFEVIDWNHHITDCRVSSSPWSIQPPTKADPTDPDGWVPFVHGGTVRRERYFQLFLGKKWLVSELYIHQTTTVKATTIQVATSNDGRAWVKNPDNKITLTNSQDPEPVPIPAAAIASYIRVYITEMNNDLEPGKFAFTFKGCEMEAKTADTCPPPEPAHKDKSKVKSDYKMRTFMVDKTTLYVCDGIQGKKGIQQKCYSTPDKETWKELDNRVGSLIGHDADADSPRYYGVSHDGMHYMSSKDGNVWETTIDADVTKAKSKSTWKDAKEVPVDGDNKLNVNSPDALYTVGEYGATHSGIHHSPDASTWSLVLKWNACCE